MIKVVVCFGVLFLAGCESMAPSPTGPPRPVLTCTDCSGLTYYGPAPTPAEDPRVALTKSIVGGVVRVAGWHYGAEMVGDVVDGLAEGGGSSVVERVTTTTAGKTTVVRPEVVTTPGATEVVRPEVVTTPGATQVIEPTVVRPEIVEIPVL